jgi:hypothetical protein
MIPLSDYGPDGAMVPFKAWACLDPQCRNSLFCDKGKVCYGIKSPNHNER